MSSCRINTNLTSGTHYEKPSSAQLCNDVKARLADLIALRDSQDKDLVNNTLTDKEYEAKYGKQPTSNDGKGGAK